MNGKQVRVLIADDQDVIRAGLKALFESTSDLKVVGEASDGASAVALAAALCPDVVVMDVRMPILDGIHATAQIASPTRVLVLTTFEIDNYVYGALRAGASGFLLKTAPAEELIEAVRLIADGNDLLAAVKTAEVIAKFATRDPVATQRMASLTAREREVLALMGSGANNQEIARALVIGEETVRTHVKRVFAKLGFRDRAQAVVFAYEAGIVGTATS